MLGYFEFSLKICYTASSSIRVKFSSEIFQNSRSSFRSNRDQWIEILYDVLESTFRFCFNVRRGQQCFTGAVRYIEFPLRTSYYGFVGSLDIDVCCQRSDSCGLVASSVELAKCFLAAGCLVSGDAMFSRLFACCLALSRWRCPL